MAFIVDSLLRNEVLVWNSVLAKGARSRAYVAAQKVENLCLSGDEADE